jgi:hypothetical protein
MKLIYKGAESYLKSINLNGKFKLTDPALFYKSMLCMFYWALLFWLHVWIYFEMFYICVKWKCVFKMIWLSFGRKMWFAKMIILYGNYVWMHAKAQRLGEDYAPNISKLWDG